MNQTVLLIGGISGAGKSTLASQVKHLYGRGAYNFDLGNVYTHTMTQDQRDERWADIMKGSIHMGLTQGFDLVIANSQFWRSDRRRDIVDSVEPRARVVPLMLATPMLEAYRRVKRGREGHTVDERRIFQAIKGGNRIVEGHDHSDMLLPTNLNDLPGEYLALLERGNKDRLEANARWVMSPEINARLCIDLVQSGVEEAHEIRSVLEGQRSFREHEYSYAINAEHA